MVEEMNLVEWERGKSMKSVEVRGTSLSVTTESMERKYWGVKSRFLSIGSLKKCGPLEKGVAHHFSILAFRTP